MQSKINQWQYQTQSQGDMHSSFHPNRCKANHLCSGPMPLGHLLWEGCSKLGTVIQLTRIFFYIIQKIDCSDVRTHGWADGAQNPTQLPYKELCGCGTILQVARGISKISQVLKKRVKISLTRGPEVTLLCWAVQCCVVLILACDCFCWVEGVVVRSSYCATPRFKLSCNYGLWSSGGLAGRQGVS